MYCNCLLVSNEATTMTQARRWHRDHWDVPQSSWTINAFHSITIRGFLYFCASLSVCLLLFLSIQYQRGFLFFYLQCHRLTLKMGAELKHHEGQTFSPVTANARSIKFWSSDRLPATAAGTHILYDCSSNRWIKDVQLAANLELLIIQQLLVWHWLQFSSLSNWAQMERQTRLLQQALH